MRQISVSVVYAKPEKQWVFEQSVPRGTSAEELIELSGFLREPLQGHSAAELSIGVYSEKVTSDYLLKDGDRLEIYRPLTADPKEVRRQLALLGKTMGKK